MLLTSLLLVSHSDKATAYFTELFTSLSFTQIERASRCTEAGRLLGERHYDAVLINTPLPDEAGTQFAISQAGRDCALFVAVKNEWYEQLAAQMEPYGIFVVARPVYRPFLVQAVHFLRAGQRRLDRMATENQRLQKKLEEMRLVERAKQLLIEHRALSEQQAHRWIEKTAMDERRPRRAVAEDILEQFAI